MLTATGALGSWPGLDTTLTRAPVGMLAGRSVSRSMTNSLACPSPVRIINVLRDDETTVPSDVVWAAAPGWPAAATNSGAPFDRPAAVENSGASSDDCANAVL